jgi:NADP-dependent 3-hydroxy acid dehydrogenase YdfG
VHEFKRGANPWIGERADPTGAVIALRGDIGAERLDEPMVVYAGSKNAVRAILKGPRQEAGDRLRVTTISPGFVSTDLASSMTNPDIRS